MTKIFQNIILYRMVTPEKICPYGLKAKALLEDKNLNFDDVILKTRAETDMFKAKHNLQTTPLIVIDGEKIGGYSELLELIDNK